MMIRQTGEINEETVVKWWRRWSRNSNKLKV